MSGLELGLDTFGDVSAAPDGTALAHAQVIRNTVEQAVLADAVGVDVFGLGEHHREDFAVSAPDVVLAAIAARTKRIRLGSAVTVLSSDDPVRIFQRFSTLNAIAGGRAEVILGRGSFTESFPLFGLALSDYEILFEEKLALFNALRKGGPVTWHGRTRSSLTNQLVYPPVETGMLPTWIAVGGSPESVVRAASYGLPLMLAIIGGAPSRFRPYVELHGRADAHFGVAPQPVGVHSPGYVAETDEKAREDFWPAYRVMHDRIGGERGWAALQRADFEREIAQGSLYVGSPETVARKIADTVRVLGLARFSLKYGAGPMPHEQLMRNIELYGRQVIPLVRNAVPAPASNITDPSWP